MTQKKNYVFDTNVLIHDPNSIFRFEDNDIYIPIYVLEEIDGLKNDQSERGRNAREAARFLDDLRTKGSLSNGVKINPEKDSGNLFVYIPKEHKKLAIATEDKKDHLILQTALDIKQNSPNRTIFVTMDVNLRIRAEVMDLQVAPYEYQSVDITSFGNEVITLEVPPEDLNEFYRSGHIPFPEDFTAEINSSVILKCMGNSKQTALGRVRSGKICKLKNQLNTVMGLKPKNVEQQFALDLLLDEDIKLVSLMGTAGSGKTILAVAAALHNTLEAPLYNKVLVARPVVAMGNDIGFLPGSTEEKLRPYMQPIYDNLDYLLMSSKSKSKHGCTQASDLFEQGKLEIEPLVYIRGRSIIQQIMIVDEAQSLTTHEIKTIISRCGENTKIIFTGDIHQIDNPYVTKHSNGFSVMVKKIRDNDMVGHLLLEKGERSKLANLAVEKL